MDNDRKTASPKTEESDETVPPSYSLQRPDRTGADFIEPAPTYSEHPDSDSNPTGEPFGDDPTEAILAPGDLARVREVRQRERDSECRRDADASTQLFAAVDQGNQEWIS